MVSNNHDTLTLEICLTFREEYHCIPDFLQLVIFLSIRI